MMNTVERTLAALRALPGADAWKLVELRAERNERYYIGRVPETARAVSKTDCDVSVYVDSGEGESRTRGECAVKIADGASDAEIAAALSRAVSTAAGMRNPWFPLAEPGSAAPVPPPNPFEGVDPAVSLEGLRAALYRHDGEGGASINSLELFLSRTATRVVNSSGVDVSWTAWNGHCEFVVNAGAGRDQVELWTERDFAVPDHEALAALARARLAAARDRLAAVPTPDCEGLPLVLAGELAGEIFAYYKANLSAQAVYERRAAFALGEDTGGPGDGDRLELEALGSMPHAALGAPYDADGFPLGSARCVVDGRVERLVAPLKYARYLGLEPTGSLRLFRLAGGRETAAALRSRDHVEVVDFSDFFVDPTGGDFGGEIRLAYLVRDGRRVAVTGGSVTGTVPANRGRIRLSAETEAKTLGVSPVLCLLPAVTVSKAT